MMLCDDFDRTRVISLPSRADRRREMQAELRRAEWGPDHRRVGFFDAIRPDSAGDFPSVGARGCFLSHLGVLREAHRDGIEKLLVLEDDLDLDSRLVVDQDAIMRRFDAEPWDFIYLGYHLDAAPTVADSGGAIQLASCPGSVGGLHFYAIRGPAIARLIDYLEAVLVRPPGDPLGGPMHVDGAYNRFREQNHDLTFLIVMPPLGHQRSTRSDIAPLRWFDRAAGVRSVVSLLRSARRRLARR